MGLDFQMVWWPDGLIHRLVDAGFAVVRSDNRDTGLSTHVDPVDRPNPWKAFMGRTPVAYTGRDMLDDALAVMDAVGWTSAHVMGGSMGAGLTQGLAMENPERVRSLVRCMGLPVDSGPLKTLTYIRPGVFRALLRVKPGPSDDHCANAGQLWPGRPPSSDGEPAATPPRASPEPRSSPIRGWVTPFPLSFTAASSRRSAGSPTLR